MIDVSTLPKAELHMHIEGSLEPEMMIALARRNGVKIRFDTPEEVAAACEFDNLQTFLDLYYAGLTVMRTEEDYFEVTHAYLKKAHEDAVRRVELYFSPQAHVRREIPVPTMMAGIAAAFDAGKRDFGIDSALVWGLQRQYSEEEALQTLDLARGYEDRIVALGMGGPEVGNPPSKFRRVYAEAKARGWKTSIHAGEEGPPAYIREALELLDVDRIDHGVRAWEDPALVAELAARGTCLTVCPLSNVRLRVYDRMEDHPVAALLRAGVRVTVNSDDPPYFGGYVNENYRACQEALSLTDAETVQLLRNSFTGCFLPEAQISAYLSELDGAVAAARAGAR
ncbi:adenosine deaminase [Celeribacter indicus]|uniref:Adenine deaminase n=1 Tax=Celeribacter indicus TaxID=1208324 RepID=A0A0B5DTT7_9RHOB|nr:adenosine deaminase [Celeribacter indicus]AJE46848.1 adenosine deaminase [Celeribacter indicus]SDW80387.1 adenosine deaminase [Celeribacter indicus]